MERPQGRNEPDRSAARAARIHPRSWSERCHYYSLRLLVRPGLSGLAQVQLVPDTDLESVRRKLACDLYYVRHRNGWLDFRLVTLHGIGRFRCPICSLVQRTAHSKPGDESSLTSLPPPVWSESRWPPERKFSTLPTARSFVQARDLCVTKWPLAA